jgi:predicted nucleic acid-binding protein
MLVVVKDACLLIDLAEADLLGLWFSLGIDTHTTDLVLAEVQHAGQWGKISQLVDAGMLKKHEFSDAWLLAAVAIHQAQSAVSLPDASALVLAKELGANLLTGDRSLRRTAEQNEVETHGILWVLDLMVQHGVLQMEAAAERLMFLRKHGSRLPEEECSTRLKKWQGKI